MDIEGLGSKLIDQLVDLKLVGDPADLFGLTIEDLLPLPLMAETRARNLIAAIAEARTRPLARVVFGLGIPNVGEHLAAVLAAEFQTMKALASADVERYTQVKEVGPVVAQAQPEPSSRGRDLSMATPAGRAWGSARDRYTS